jgi:hypothetical protein
MCTDHRCTNGITECAGCNGFGWVTMAGRKYRKRTGARNLLASTTKRVHEDCHGSGAALCGCTQVDPEAMAELFAAARAAAEETTRERVTA